MASLTQLEYVLAVDQYRHFGKAAHAIPISQPTLSHQIQKLEDELGIILFDRLQKPVVVTPEGTRFIEQAKSVVREHRRLLQIAKQSKTKSAGLQGEFRLGIIPTVASHLLPLFVGIFSKKYPEVELFIEELKTETILSEIKSDRLDGAILATPLEESGFKEHPLYYEPFDLYLSPGHTLLNHTTLTSKDLDGSSLWLLKDGHCFKTQVVNFCSVPKEQDTVFSKIHFQSGSLETLRTLVRNNRGYTLIPRLMTLSLPKTEIKAHVRPFRTPIPTREISLIYRRDHWKLDIIQAIESCVQAGLPDEVARTRSAKQLVLGIC